jgi:hypothetical protein
MVLLGESSSEKRYTENGVIQGAVINVILFLLALADIVSQVQHPVEIIGYADDGGPYQRPRYGYCSSEY